MTEYNVWTIDLSNYDDYEREQRSVVVESGMFAVFAASSETDADASSREFLTAVATLDDTVKVVMDAHASGRFRWSLGGTDLVLTDRKVAAWDDYANTVTGYDIYLDGTFIHSWVDAAFVTDGLPDFDC